MGKHVQGEKDNINTISEFCAHYVTRCTYSVFNPVHTHTHTKHNPSTLLVSDLFGTSPSPFQSY